LADPGRSVYGNHQPAKEVFFDFFKTIKPQ